jgi:Electron transfer DM13
VWQEPGNRQVYNRRIAGVNGTITHKMKDMSKLFFIITTMIVLMVSCKKQNETTQLPANDKIDTSKAAIKYTGKFVSTPEETVSGNALVLVDGGTYSLALQTFSVNNGPDLHLYLSKQLQPVDFIDLGKLKSIKGDQVYALNKMPDFSQYRYALIYCQQYSVLFGSAELK